MMWSNDAHRTDPQSPFATLGSPGTEPAPESESESESESELGHELTPPPDGVSGQATYESPEQSAVRLVIATGKTDVNELTNLVFFARHPERGGRALAPSEPDFSALSSEWKTIRDTIVRPVLDTVGSSELWVPGAVRVSNSRSRGGSYLNAPWRFVFHTIEGEPSADAFRRLAARHGNPPHLWAMPSADLLLQTIPLNRSAYALTRPGSTQTNRLRAVQVEVWGYAATMAGASRDTIEWLADRLLAPVARMVPINLTQVRPPGTVKCYGTRSACRMTADEWRHFNGVCGHKDVPDNAHWDPGGLDMVAIAARAGRRIGHGSTREEHAVADHDGPEFLGEWESGTDWSEHDGTPAMTAMAWAPPAGPVGDDTEEREDGAVEQDEFDACSEHEGGTGAVACVFPSGVRLRVVSGSTGPDEEHYDPNNSGEPLYDTGAAVRSTRLARNFLVSEFATSGGTPSDLARISCALVDCLQRIRDHVGRAVTITSGYRSYRYNLELYRRRGRRPTRSQHSSGRAADIRISGMPGVDIAKLALELCGTEIGVGVGTTYAHLDVRGKYARWTYLRDAGESARIIAELDAHRGRLRTR